MSEYEYLVRSEDAEHPANHISTLCAKFYNLGWVHPLTIIWAYTAMMPLIN